MSRRGPRDIDSCKVQSDVVSQRTVRRAKLSHNVVRWSAEIRRATGPQFSPARPNYMWYKRFVYDAGNVCPES